MTEEIRPPATGGTPAAHAASHEDGGSDEIDVTGLTGAGGGAGLDLSGLTIERAVQGVSDYVAGYDASAADERGIPVGSLQIGRGFTVIKSDCFFVSTTSVLDHIGQINAGTASGTAGLQSAGFGVNHPGVITCVTGSTATGRCGLQYITLSTLLVLGGGKVRFGAVVALEDLSDGTNRYAVRMGMANIQTGDGSNSVLFRYSDNVNGGKWEAVCRSASVETAVDTGITADAGLGAFHTYEFEVNAAGTSVEFFIDGASVATITTNIPTGTGNATSFLAAAIYKSLGTTSRRIFVDAYWYILEFTTAR